jgi:hypothetical protein
MSDEMINKTTPLKAGKVDGIKETLEWMNEFDMNVMNDTIGKKSK